MIVDESALDFCKQNNSELIVLEVRPDDRDLLKIFSEMKALCPQGQVVALIHDENDRRPAEQAQVDLILSIGTRASKLKADLEELAHS